MRSALRPVALTGADQATLATSGMFGGYNIRNSHATNASTIQIYDNASAASGTLIASLGLAAGVSFDVVYAIPIWCVNGIFVHVTGTGTIQ
jgi:hypothetical protein